MNVEGAKIDIVKMLINKEDFGIVDVVLDEIRFRFNGCWVDFLLIFVVFYDMRCDKGVGESGMGDLVDFVGRIGIFDGKILKLVYR